jgi:DNA topoisomerase VI subunit B
MATQAKPELVRQVFTTSRELEYFTETELVAQTGYRKEEWWPGVLTKELVDNGLDVCEQAGIAPEIRVEFSGGTLTVSDNGPGIPPEVVERVLDFTTRTSDKAGYVSPMRGAQGNALKTVLAIPYVLSGRQPSTVIIEARGLRHVITVATDQIARRPQIEHETGEIVKIEGTTIRVAVDSACPERPVAEDGFLQNLLLDYSLFNPHADFVLEEDGEVLRFERTDAEWTKWLPSHPTSPHWYNAERLENLIASYVAAERSGGRARTVREFVAEFRGLAGTAKQKQVLAGAGLERAYLRDLVAAGRIDHSALDALLQAMQRLSAPVKPEALGILGEAHFDAWIANGTDSDGFRYKRLTGIDTEGLPFVVECAFALSEDPLLQGVHIGLNWSVPLSNPIERNEFTAADGDTVWGLGGLLESNRIDLDDDPICLALHIICPRFKFLERGKGSVHLPPAFAQAVSKAVLDTTREWAAVKKKQERDQRQAERLMERISRKPHEHVSVKQAAYNVIPEAYRKASGNGRYPANARQIMYAARPAIQELTGRSLDDTYFTQTLLPDYMREHAEEAANWDVVYDARGHLWEPHSGYEVGLGTLGVREYLADMRSTPRGLGISIPDFSFQFPTCGPMNRYGAILYVEKEGFLPLLRQVGLAEKYDMAIMSSKGMGTTAVRTLFEKLSGQVMILVLHDFDKSGFSIVGTLRRDTRRYAFTTVPRVIDLGLRLEDVLKWNLAAEDVINDSDPTDNLMENGATPEEVAFLRGTPMFDGGRRQKYRGQRVELNAFTSDQFIAWLEGKLQEHGVEKVIPDDTTLNQAYRRGAAIQRCQAILDKALAEVETHASGMEVPQDLHDQVRQRLVAAPSLAWDEAIEGLLPPVIQDE